jgi:hypothetical protein
MKTLDLRQEAITLEQLLQVANTESVLIVSENGNQYILENADAFDQEVTALGNSENFMNFLAISIAINQKSAIGDLFQEWFSKWLTFKNIDFRTKSNTQEFPDFLLDPESNQKHLLEVKTFNYSASPAFDIANFEAYCRSLKNSPYRLDADYLIFGYELINAKFYIREIWLKKIWEITGSSERYPINCQIKQDIIYNIRPVLWYSTSNRVQFKPFTNKREFVESLYKTLTQYPKTTSSNKDWLNIVENSYYNYTGQRL